MPEDPGLSVNNPQPICNEAADGLALSELSQAWRREIPAIEKLCRSAVNAVFDTTGLLDQTPEISIALADNDAVHALNRDYRGMDKPTNVLSFPSGEDAVPPEADMIMLGDIILAFETVREEAADQNKPIKNHTSHLVVHGVLHLLGYDHEDDNQAEEMEMLERQILAKLGVDDPYRLPDQGDAA